MFKSLDHIAIISSRETSVDFYKKIGFIEVKRNVRENDVIVFLEGYGVTLEVFVDPKHPTRVTNPEAMGLRHLAFVVDNIEETAKMYDLNIEPIRSGYGIRYTFFKDPDGLPIELQEK